MNVKRPSLQVIAPLALLGAFGLACASSNGGTATAPVQLAVEDAYQFAAKLELPEVAPANYRELHNVYQLSNTILSGGEPLGESAFEELEKMGVKTVISVDGKIPNLDAAGRHGMRYVHIPIQYKGITDEEVLRLTKTFRELESPIYVHCFHGRHRGPAAAAIGRVALDGASRERAVAEMRQWFGTSKKYSGLYHDIATKVIPSDAESRAYAWDFPSTRPMQGFRQSMVEIPRLFDNLNLLADLEFQPDPEHPDLDALNEARALELVLKEACALPEVAERPADFQEWMNKSRDSSEGLVRSLEEAAVTSTSFAIYEAQVRLDEIGKLCSKCHRSYRNSN